MKADTAEDDGILYWRPNLGRLDKYSPINIVGNTWPIYLRESHRMNPLVSAKPG